MAVQPAGDRRGGWAGRDDVGLEGRTAEEGKVIDWYRQQLLMSVPVGGLHSAVGLPLLPFSWPHRTRSRPPCPAPYTPCYNLQAVEVGAGRKVFDLQLPDLAPYSLDFSRSGRHMLLAGRKGHLALMDWQRTRLICEVQVRGGSRGCKGCCCVVAAVVVTAVAAIAAAVRHCAVVC